MTMWLSMHASYACRHAGACCSSGWPIPVERARADLVRRAVKDGRIAMRGEWLRCEGRTESAAGVLATGEHGCCVFRLENRCAIHQALGPGALPLACQHFPRVVLIDPRGTFVTLSHYCPTAAALLFDAETPLSIVQGPPALPDGAPPEGLDAREAWPPLLTPRTLMDHESYAAWEAYMVRTLAEEPPVAALSRLEAGLRALEQWRPDHGSLLAAVSSLVERPVERTLEPSGEMPIDLAESRRWFDRVRRAVPDDFAWPDPPHGIEAIWRRAVEPSWASWTPVVGRYLAARAFASWVAYQGRSLRAVVNAVRAALAVLVVEAARACAPVGAVLDRARLTMAIRQSDLLLVHHAERQPLADLMSC